MKRTSFNSGWEFSRNGGPFESVVVPHDAMLGNGRSPDAPAGSNSGYFLGGSYRYCKQFLLDARQAAGSIMLEFEGVYRDARIRVNGADVPAPPYGFVPFFIDLAGLVREGENTIEVEADNIDQPDCRWYSGAGIYRPVWMWEGPAKHIEPEGIRVTTLSVDPVSIRVEVACNTGTPCVSILDAERHTIAIGKGTDMTFDLPKAHLWSAEEPYLYRCSVRLRDEGRTDGSADEAEVAFGIRLLTWSPYGLFVNKKRTLLQGGCIHCDNGILGAASFPESEWRRVRLLKEAGFNAVRVAHNPAPTSLLDACDQIGLYVIDEAWDMWFTHKSRADYATHFLGWCDHDLRHMAARDFNHPSVIAYSIGNEVADPLVPGGVELEQSMVELLHALDPTRPVTCGINLTMLVMERIGRGWYGQETGVGEPVAETDAPRSSMMFNLAAQAAGHGMTLLANVPGTDALASPALDALDIAGYNYASARYALDARKHPDRIVVGTETFPYELPSNWRKCQRIPNLIGDFMWAAWDYLGEAGAGSWAYTAAEAGFSKPWPWLIAGSGALDITGRPNAAAALAGAAWKTACEPSIQVRPVNRMEGRTYKATWRGTDAVPSWSWQGCEGTRAQVEVYDGRAHSILLRLNGQSVGQARVHDCLARFSLAYEPGTLEAIALDAQGNTIGCSTLASACAPFHLHLAAEEEHPRAGGIAYVAIEICGTNGQVEANADEQVEAVVDGGTLLGFGSAEPAPTDSFLTGRYTTYRGRAQAVVYRSEPGTAVLTVRGATLTECSISIVFAEKK